MDFYVHPGFLSAEFSNKLIALGFDLNAINKTTIINIFDSDNRNTSTVNTQHHHIIWKPLRT